MNIKLALAVLFCSVAMSCSMSEGQLIDRMLTKMGCGICESANVCDTGCDSGCGGEIVASDCCAADSCGCGGRPGILDRIKGRLASVGCGGGCDAAPSCGCEEPVVESCGCDAAPSCGGGLLDKLKARLSGLGSGCGCASAPDDCGCNIAPVILEEPCGCDTAPSCGLGLLDRLKGRFASIGSGCASPVIDDCGCGMPEPAPCVTPVVESCGCNVAPACDTAPSCGGGLLDRLKGRLSSIGGGGCGCSAPVADGCGCEAPAPVPCVTPAPVASCGCDAAPAADCGCNGGRLGGLMGRLRSAGSCGCDDAAPVITSCGTPMGRLTLLDRLRGNRIPRDRCGSVVGSGCNDGCNSPCPGNNAGCGCGSTYGAPATMSGEVITTEAPAAEAAPAVAEPADSGVIEEAPAETDLPAVDPNAFINRRGNARG